MRILLSLTVQGIPCYLAAHGFFYSPAVRLFLSAVRMIIKMLHRPPRVAWLHPILFRNNSNSGSNNNNNGDGGGDGDFEIKTDAGKKKNKQNKSPQQTQAPDTSFLVMSARIREGNTPTLTFTPPASPFTERLSSLRLHATVAAATLT